MPPRRRVDIEETTYNNTEIVYMECVNEHHNKFYIITKSTCSNGNFMRTWHGAIGGRANTGPVKGPWTPEKLNHEVGRLRHEKEKKGYRISNTCRSSIQNNFMDGLRQNRPSRSTQSRGKETATSPEIQVTPTPKKGGRFSNLEE